MAFNIPRIPQGNDGSMQFGMPVISYHLEFKLLQRIVLPKLKIVTFILIKAILVIALVLILAITFFCAFFAIFLVVFAVLLVVFVFYTIAV